MSNIVFDIETVGLKFDSLSDNFKEYILKYTDTEQEKEAEKQKLGLWPLTAQIVTIAMIYEDTGKGYVFFQSPDKKIERFEENNIKFISCSEAQILKNFWKVISSANKFVTFYGRGFDCPFILIRSALNKIKATRNLMPARYSINEHIDLLDQLTFYGSLKKNFTLDLWCQAFNIESPKQKYAGCDVNRLFNEAKYTEIAKYCLADVKATLELYKYWDNYIRT